MEFTCQRVIKSVIIGTMILDGALLATYSSPFEPLRAFSYFAAILVTMSALIVIILVPSLLVIHDKCCLCNCGKNACVCVDEGDILVSSDEES